MCEKKIKILTQKYLDILHTWDSSTKMQQIYDLNFSDDLPPTKGKEGQMVTLSYVNWVEFVIHIPPLGTQTQTKWHTHPARSMVYKCAKLHRSVIMVRQKKKEKKKACNEVVNYLIQSKNLNYSGTLCYLIYHLCVCTTFKVNKWNLVFHSNLPNKSPELSSLSNYL